VALILSLSAGRATADEPITRHPVFPVALWLTTQLVPSPSLAMGASEVSFGLRWQVTPLLYAWGVNRKVSGWRSFVVEPNFRQGGSVELFVAPELFFTDSATVLVRPGVRAYFPVVDHGEYLSVSAAISYQRVGGRDAVAGELGAYMLFGILGLQVSVASGPATPMQTIATIRLRYF